MLPFQLICLLTFNLLLTKGALLSYIGSIHDVQVNLFPQNTPQTQPLAISLIFLSLPTVILKGITGVIQGTVFFQKSKYQNI